jgi:hypothetical protein
LHASLGIGRLVLPVGGGAIERLSTVRRAHLPDLLAKQSRSTLTDLGVEIVHRLLLRLLRVETKAWLERPRGVLEQLLPPGVDLMGAGS